MAAESWGDQLARVQAMATDETGLKWDLSDNDRAALLAVLERLADLDPALESLIEFLMRVNAEDRERGMR